jgi:hypothetical protein
LARSTFTFTERAIERALNFLELKADELAQRCRVDVQTIRRARRGQPIVIEDAAAIAQCVHDAGYKIAGPYILDETDLFDNFLSTLRRQRGRMKSVLLFDRVPGQDNRLAVKERTHHVKLSKDDTNFRFGGRPGEILSISSLQFSVEQHSQSTVIPLPNGSDDPDHLLSLVSRVKNEHSAEEQVGLSVPLPEHLKGSTKGLVMITDAHYNVPFERLFAWQTAFTAHGFDVEITMPDRVTSLEVESFLIEPPRHDNSANADGRTTRIYKTDRHVPAGCGLVWRFRPR